MGLPHLQEQEHQQQSDPSSADVRTRDILLGIGVRSVADSSLTSGRLNKHLEPLGDPAEVLVHPELKHVGLWDDHTAETQANFERCTP